MYVYELRKKLLKALSCVLVALLFTLGTALANPYYEPYVLSEDIHKACTSISLATNGTLSARCYGKKVKGLPTNRVTAYNSVNTSIKLNDHIGNSRFEKRMVCGWNRFLSDCKNASVTAKENGLHLTATCRASAMWRGNELNLSDRQLEMNLNDCFEVDNGSLSRK